MLGIKKTDMSKIEELGYKKDDDGYFYTKVKDGVEITFEEEGVIIMCNEGSTDYYNSDDNRFDKNLIKDLIDNDLVEETELFVEEVE